MNRYKCKGCKWYNKPYWSIINPCENCPREETNVEIITRWIDPTIEEKDKEIERLNNTIEEKDKEIDKLNKRVVELRETIRLANNNVLKDISMINTIGMEKQEIIQRLLETSKILEGVDKLWKYMMN